MIFEKKLAVAENISSKNSEISKIIFTFATENFFDNNIMAEELNNAPQLNIDLPEDVADGNYVNLAMLTHSSSEFVIDFLKLMPGMRRPSVKSRVILAPEHAKRLLLALQDNVSKYEQRFGRIKNTDGAGGNTMPFNFGNAADA